MGVTKFPNGVGSDADYALSYEFTTASTAQTTYRALPVECVLSHAVVTVSTSARVAAYTVGIGSAGTALVDGVSNTTGIEGSVSSLTISSAQVATVAAGSAIRIVRGAQGSTGATQITLFFKRTA